MDIHQGIRRLLLLSMVQIEASNFIPHIMESLVPGWILQIMPGLIGKPSFDYFIK